MPIRPIVIYMMISALGLVASIDVRAASADTEAYNGCMKKELSQLEQIAMYCHAMNANSASMSQNPGSANDAPAQVDGLVQDCIRSSEAKFRQEASKKCSAIARGIADEGIKAAIAGVTDEEPQSPGTSEDAKSEGCRGPRCNTNLGPTGKIPIPEARPDPKKATTTTAKPKAEAAATNRSSATAPKKEAATSADRTRVAAAESIQNQSVQEPNLAGTDANGDIQLCESSYSTANRCCGSPTSCLSSLSAADQRSYAQLAASLNGPPASGQGLTDYCRQMQGLGSSGRDVNVTLAGICNSKQSTCSTVCSQLADKYQNLIASCNGCASQHIYQDAYSKLTSRNSSCNALARRVDQIASQAVSGSSSASYANLCNQVTAANPQTDPGSAPQPRQPGSFAAIDPASCAANPNSPACQNCAANPNSAACRALANREATGTAAFGVKEQPAAKRGNFNIDQPPVEDTSGFAAPASAVEAQAVANQTVANNSGGAIPGAGNETSAKLGSDGRPQISPGSPGYTTDVFQGMQGGNGYSAAAVQASTGDGPGLFSRLFGGGSEAAPDHGGGFLGMDLRQFLPGGSRDPKRRIAGFGHRSEINAKEEDIWRRISNKMEEKCKLGILIGCR